MSWLDAAPHEERIAASDRDPDPRIDPMPPIRKPPAPTPPAGGEPIPPAGGEPIPPAGGEPIPPAGGEPIPPAGSEPIPPAGSEPIPPAGSGATAAAGGARGRRSSATTGGTALRAGTGQGAGTALDALFGGGCGDRDILGLPSFERIEGIEPDNLRTAADAYHEGMFEQIGAFRAIDELVARFLGGLNLGTVGLRNNLCNYMRQEPLRLTREDRYHVLSLFADETLERLLLRLSDAVIAFDLSRAPGIALTPATLPEAATKLAVIEVIEELELFLDDAGGGGANFVTNEVGKQLRDILFILDDEQLRCHVPGDDVDDVFAIIAGLLANEKDRPPDWEVRQMARKASFGRKIFLEIADHVAAVNNALGLPDADPDAADVFQEGELDAIGALAYQWRVAHGTLYPDVADDADADEEAADESRLQVIRLRRRVSA